MVPPPMSSSEITTSENIVDCSISFSGSRIAILTAASIEVHKWDFRSRPTVALKKVASFFFAMQAALEPKVISRQILVHNEDRIEILSHFETGGSKISSFRIVASSASLIDHCADFIPFDKDQGGLIRNSHEYIWAQKGNGLNWLDQSVFSSSSIVNSSSEILLGEGNGQQQRDVDNHSSNDHGQAHKHAHMFSLSQKGELFADGKLVARGCTSFVTTEAYLIFTTSQQLLKFVHIYASDGRSSGAH
jgi:elongator complex protein 1